MARKKCVSHRARRVSSTQPQPRISLLPSALAWASCSRFLLIFGLLPAYSPAMDWHRLFGLLLADFFTDSPFVVEVEKDLSFKRQRLDVVILRRGQGSFTDPLPDGFDDLVAHNLITFKSHREALDDWALKELTGHYVNYLKQLLPPKQPLLPETDFRLYAVCGRYPHNLASTVEFQELRPGVYQCRRGSDVIRVIVVGRLPRT